MSMLKTVVLLNIFLWKLWYMFFLFLNEEQQLFLKLIFAGKKILMTPYLRSHTLVNEISVRCLVQPTKRSVTHHIVYLIFQSIEETSYSGRRDPNLSLSFSLSLTLSRSFSRSCCSRICRYLRLYLNQSRSVSQACLCSDSLVKLTAKAMRAVRLSFFSSIHLKKNRDLDVKNVEALFY